MAKFSDVAKGRGVGVRLPTKEPAAAPNGPFGRPHLLPAALRTRR